MHAALYSILTGAAGVTALVGSRIYLVRAPQSTTQPYVWFEDRNVGYVRSLAGDENYRRALVDVNCVGASSSSAIAVSAAVVSALNGARGTYASIEVVNIAVLGEDTNALAPAGGEEYGPVERSLDVEVTWRTA